MKPNQENYDRSVIKLVKKYGLEMALQVIGTFEGIDAETRFELKNSFKKIYKLEIK